MDPRQSGRLRQGADRSRLRRPARDVESPSRASTKNAAQRFRNCRKRKPAATPPPRRSATPRRRRTRRRRSASWHEVATLKETIQAGEAGEKRLDSELRDAARHHSQHSRFRRAGRRGRRRQQGSARRRRSSEIFVSAEAAFRARRGARPHGFRDRRQVVRRALRGAEGRARQARACARPVHARPAYERARLYRDQPAAPRARRRHVRHRATAEIRRGSVRGGCRPRRHARPRETRLQISERCARERER